MKKTLLLLFTLLLALSAQSQNSLRLMTYNIKMQTEWMMYATSNA